MQKICKIYPVRFSLEEHFLTKKRTNGTRLLAFFIWHHLVEVQLFYEDKDATLTGVVLRA